VAALEGLARRVVLTGSESTGKTTLTADLARHYDALWVPEYARSFAVWKGAALNAGDVDPIARGQIAVQDAALMRARRLLLLDTDLLSTAVYARHYYGRCPDWVAQVVPARRADLYLLCDIDVPWAEDPQRDRPHERAQLHDLFDEALRAQGFPVVRIRGSWRDRFHTARTAIDALLDHPNR
jgi:HTH-type transcriptional repressor of NAD biosynthesis genes